MAALLDLWPLPYRLAAVAALVLAAAGFGWVNGAEHGEAKLDAYRVAQQKAIDAQVAKAASTTADLKAKADTLTREKNNEVHAIALRLDAALGELRQRPARRPDLPEAAAACAGATGADLSGPDGEFLAREAARADRLRAALGQCQAQYQSALEALSKP